MTTISEFKELEDGAQKVLDNRHEQNSIGRNLRLYLPSIKDDILPNMKDEVLKKRIENDLQNFTGEELTNKMVQQKIASELGDTLDQEESGSKKIQGVGFSTIGKIVYLQSFRSNEMDKTIKKFVIRKYRQKKLMEYDKGVEDIKKRIIEGDDIKLPNENDREKLKESLIEDSKRFVDDVFIPSLKRYEELATDSYKLKENEGGKVGKLYKHKIKNMKESLGDNYKIEKNYKSYSKKTKHTKAFAVTTNISKHTNKTDSIDIELGIEELVEMGIKENLAKKLSECETRRAASNLIDTFELKNSQKSYVIAIYESYFQKTVQYDSVEDIIKNEKEVLYKNPESFLMAKRREILRLHKALSKGRIVETPYVKQVIDRMMPSLLQNPPKPVYLYGELGSGKTEICKHVSRTRFGKEPVILSGHKNMTINEIKGGLKLERDQNFKRLLEIIYDLKLGDDYLDEMKQLESIHLTPDRKATLFGDMKHAYEAQQTKKLDDDIASGKIPKIERQNLLNSYLKYFDAGLEDFFRSPVVVAGYLGAMYKAMKDGVPLIIDEVNAIPHEVFIFINELLTLKVGEKPAAINGLKQFVIKEGYCVMMTGNPLNERYKFRNEMDIAALSRFDTIPLNYLPQDFLDNTMFDRLYLDEDNDTDLETKLKNKSKNEIYEMFILSLLDSNLGLRVPKQKIIEGDEEKSKDKGILKKLYNLAMATKIFQNAFDDIPLTDVDLLENIGRYGESDKDKDPSRIKFETTVSNRTIMDILGKWKDNDFNMDLDYYLWEYCIKEAQNNEEKEFFYRTLNWFGFFQAPGFPDPTAINDVNKTSLKIDQLDLSKLQCYTFDQNRGIKELSEKEEKIYFSPSYVVGLLYAKLEDRSKEDYDKLDESDISIVENMNIVTQIQVDLGEIIEELSNLNKVNVALDDDLRPVIFTYIELTKSKELNQICDPIEEIQEQDLDKKVEDIQMSQVFNKLIQDGVDVVSILDDFIDCSNNTLIAIQEFLEEKGPTELSDEQKAELMQMSDNVRFLSNKYKKKK